MNTAAECTLHEARGKTFPVNLGPYNILKKLFGVVGKLESLYLVVQDRLKQT
jgi:hypothetical protein